MFFYKLFSRFSTTIPRTSLLSAQRIPQQQFHNFSNQFHSLLIPQSTNKVLKKFGVEKFDHTNEPFDPHRHNAVFQVPDGSKPPGTVAAVLKAGYLLHDRVIRPAEVGVTQAKEDKNPAE